MSSAESVALDWCRALVAAVLERERGRPRAAALEEHFESALATLTIVEQAALAYDWREWWARPGQIEPPGDWRSWGLCTGRSYGKTRALAEYVHGEAASGRAMRICMIAQDEETALEIMVHGDSGIMSVAPPWDRPVYQTGRLLWPSGAQAWIKTPQQPGAIRGPGYHLAWASEVVAWPPTKMDEAMSNLKRTTRLGKARTVWDTTPKRRHAIIRDLLERSKKEPTRHVVVRGNSRENVANFNPDALEEWEHELDGTSRGREELHGEFIEDAETALVQYAWIERNRLDAPAKYDRRVMAIDPAISMRRSTDATGLIEAGKGVDGRYYVIEDSSARIAWEVWGELVVERYLANALDCIIVERNRGGDAVAANLRACARERCHSTGERIVVQLVGPAAKTRSTPGVIYVKEAQARTAKETRAEPVAALYEKGLVSHVNGSDLAELEDQWTTWDPESGKSPNALDACVWALWDLAGLAADGPVKHSTAEGIGLMREALRHSPERRAGMGLLPRLGRRASSI